MIQKIIEEVKGQVEITDSPYEFNGVKVPRATRILSTIHDEYLMNWANNVGLYQRKKYEDVRDNAATIGTHGHNGIEEYIKTGIYTKGENLVFEIKDAKKINNCVESFILWYNDIKSKYDIDIISIEESMSCPYFGGTLDMLCTINGIVYLVDFKTSNHIGYKYFMQLAAYRYMLKNIKNIDIGGCIILQVSKKRPSYEEYTLDLIHNDFHLSFINRCETAFFSAVNMYYNKIAVENMFNEYNSNR